LCRLEPEFLDSGAVAGAVRRVIELSNDNKTIYYAACVTRICGCKCARDLIVRLWNFVLSPTTADATKVAVVELIEDIFTCESVEVKAAVCMLVAVGMSVGDATVREHLARPVFVQEMVDIVDEVGSDWAELILDAVFGAIESVDECRIDLVAHGGIKVLEQVEAASPRAADVIEATLKQLAGDA
jgi:hypothetical protein